jgi:hypothetical protein
MSNFYNQQITGLTPQQYDFAVKNYSNKGFVADTSRINNYSNPMANIADRYWQEQMRKDTSNYTWSKSDQISYSKNSNFGPHNVNFDSVVYKK